MRIGEHKSKRNITELPALRSILAYNRKLELNAKNASKTSAWHFNHYRENANIDLRVGKKGSVV